MRPGFSRVVFLAAAAAFLSGRQASAQGPLLNAPAGVHAGAGNALGIPELAPQDRPAQKYPALSWALSFAFPGIGQFYNGEPGKGIPMVIMGAVGLAAVLVGTAAESSCDTDFGGCSEDDSNTNAAVVAVGAVIFVGTSIWSQIDAPIAAGKINHKNGYASGLHVDPRVVALRSAAAASHAAQPAGAPMTPHRAVGLNMFSYTF